MCTFDPNLKPKGMENSEKSAFPTENAISERVTGGLTKREYFAAMAMQGLLANESDNARSETKTIEIALKCADELLKQLEQ